MNCFRNVFVAAALGVAVGVASASPYSGLVIFGDSLSDAGNIALAIGADPTQVITGNGYIPNQPYASGQFSNGNVWAKTFATALGFGSAAVPSLAGGSDYAFGGARMATDGAGLAPSLSVQTSMYLGAHGTAAGDALYVVEGGGNDARDALFAAAAAADPFAAIAAAASAYALATGVIVDRLQAAGAQHIVVWDVPDLGTVPAVTSLGAGASFLGTQIALAMNGALSARMAGETGVSIFDFFALEEDIVARPGAYGLLNATDACGALPSCNPSTYMFWDGIHPTSAGHALLSQGMLAAVAVPEPAPYALVLAGLVLMRLRMHRESTAGRADLGHQGHAG